MLIGFNEKKPIWETIPPKFHKYFNDSSMEIGYWEEEKDLPLSPKQLAQKMEETKARANQWIQIAKGEK